MRPPPNQSSKTSLLPPTSSTRVGTEYIFSNLLFDTRTFEFFFGKYFFGQSTNQKPPFDFGAKQSVTQIETFHSSILSNKNLFKFVVF